MQRQGNLKADLALVQSQLHVVVQPPVVGFHLVEFQSGALGILLQVVLDNQLQANVYTV